MVRPTIRDMTSELGLSSHARILEVKEPSCGLLAFIALHDVNHGPCVGGVRRSRYRSAEDACNDALSLSAQMTRKVAFAGLPCGGGKSVIVDHKALDRNAAYAAFGRAVEMLDGQYFCGPDVGTGTDALERIREHTSYVNPADNDASVATAKGVLAGLRSALSECPSIGPLSAVVQGAGNVGSLVVKGLRTNLHSELALSVSDPNVRALRSLPEDVRKIASDVALRTPAHMFIPCALGPVVSRENVRSLPFSVICGSANTQLEDDAVAQVLHARGILYAPDFIVNAGAVIEGATVLFSKGDNVRERAKAAIDRIEYRLSDVFHEARENDASPLNVAVARTIRR
ncbi:MAG: Glu/Leu/Phe/Val dehydrogenase dimerization domain-containing protein [Myxococcota bacterium]|nr:Glu/Leu/Phe/Val dehydrogenase dimerization domain-containing protein [Myxococcota bacterium]